MCGEHELIPDMDTCGKLSISFSVLLSSQTIFLNILFAVDRGENQHSMTTNESETARKWQITETMSNWGNRKVQISQHARSLGQMCHHCAKNWLCVIYEHTNNKNKQVTVSVPQHLTNGQISGYFSGQTFTREEAKGSDKTPRKHMKLYTTI